MRVTRESLLRLAREIAQERAYRQADILAIYLIGSLRKAEPFLGQNTDIDLVMVYEARPPLWREIVALPAGIHLDILHRARNDYPASRQLRLHPTLGHEMYDALLLYERQPFFEFLQAGVRAGGEFNAPGTVCQRAFYLLAESRKGWLELSRVSAWNAKEMNAWLEVLSQTANALMELNGSPLTDRRFLHDFAQRLAELQLPELFPPFLELLGEFDRFPKEVHEWLPHWETDFQAAAQSAGRMSEIHTARLPYYLQGIRHYLEGERPGFALWPLLRTWTWSAMALPQEQRLHWEEFLRHMGWEKDAHSSRLEALDHYLDRVEEVLESYATRHGVDLDTLPRLL